MREKKAKATLVLLMLLLPGPFITAFMFSASSSAPVHDIAVAKVATSKTIIGQGYSMQINVTVRNLGDFIENFNTTVSANSIIVDEKPTTLASQFLTCLTFMWNTTGFAKGIYAIMANAAVVPSEIDTVNNKLNNGTVVVVAPGDVNADGIVDILDVSGLSAHWYPGPPIGPLGYDPNFDINNDGETNIVDLSTISAYWGTRSLDVTTLRIDGYVTNHLDLTLSQLIAMPKSSEYAEIYCIHGAPGIPVDKGNWTGVRLGLVLETAGISPQGVKVAFHAEDNYSTDLTVQTAMREDIIIAYEKDGAPLPEVMRLVVLGKWGYKWISRLNHIELVNYDFLGTWESRGFSDVADIPP